MDLSLRARTHTVLRGVPLPAGRARLIAYARSQGAEADVLAALRTLPDERFGSLDEVGERLVPVQPRPLVRRRLPRPESGEPPGGDAYAASEVRPPAG